MSSSDAKRATASCGECGAFATINSKAIVAIDGSKFEAVGNRDKIFTDHIHEEVETVIQQMRQLKQIGKRPSRSMCPSPNCSAVYLMLETNRTGP